MNEELTEYWLDLAEQDLRTAKNLFRSRDYHWALFLGHLVLEKSLKAYYVHERDKDAPYGHNLVILAKKCAIELTDDQMELLETVSDFNIEARYPDYKLTFMKKCTEDFTSEYLTKIEDFYKWLLLRMTS